MNQNEAISHADAAAGVVGLKAPPSTSFAGMLKVDAVSLAQFLDANPELDAEGLYLFSRRIAGKEKFKPWAELAPRTRCAFDVFRATYAVLMRYVRTEELAERERERGKLTGERVVRMGERTFDERTPGFNDRVKLR